MRETIISLCSVAVGAFLAVVGQWIQSRSERRERRITRWDETRLDTYTRFGREVRSARQRAERLVVDGMTADPQNDEWVRDRLREESLLLETIQLVATAPVREQANLVHKTLRDAMQPPSIAANLKASGIPIAEFHIRCRAELEIERAL